MIQSKYILVPLFLSCNGKNLNTNFPHSILCMLTCFAFFFAVFSGQKVLSLCWLERETWKLHKNYASKLFATQQKSFERKNIFEQRIKCLETIQFEQEKAQKCVLCNGKNV